MAKFKFVEENNQYKIETDSADEFIELNDKYHKIGLSDVDLIIIEGDNAILMEYKNSNIPMASNPESFERGVKEDKHILKIARKYCDSLLYLSNIDRVIEKKKYFYVLETRNMDSILRKMIAGKIKKKLPFELKDELNLSRTLIDEFEVISIDEWNQRYSQFSFSSCEE